ncbi:hypothetical protein SteCoe_4857 [Stentor coeruleus]|uniref:Uncharacterized protein n=1 Tax=Stentor coeruleus TaxID=5963 RepID=A0A1R2CTQ6_9CILI|nr:hypothetical protein SteCoe_4857 [Stentor coeruleus]
MQKEKIVKKSISRSSSSESLKLKAPTNKVLPHNPEKKSSRESSISSSKSPLKKFETKVPRLDFEKAFIRPKPSSKALRSNSSEKTLTFPTEESQENPIKPVLHEYTLLDTLTSKFTIKTIESMKKEYNLSTANEIVFRNFLAVLSQIDPLFHQNRLLQFSMSKARDIFNVYTSRPGQVLQTLKILSKLCENAKVPKLVISQCKKDIKNVDKSKLKGSAVDTLEALKIVIRIQNKLYKPIKKNKAFELKGFNFNKQILESFATEDKNCEMSIIDINTFTTEGEGRSCSPNIVLEENKSLPLKSINSNDQNKSSKKKILEQLYSKLNGPNIFDDFDLNIESKENPIKSQESIEIDVKVPETSSKKTMGGIKSKPARRSNSNSTIPSYMRCLNRPLDIIQNSPKQNLQKRKSEIKTKQWEQLKKVNIQEKTPVKIVKTKENISESNKKQGNESSKEAIKQKKRFEISLTEI